MKIRLEEKKRAIELRIQGKTYREILSLIPNLSKSTLSGWLRNVKLTNEQEEKLRKNIERITYNAKVKSAWLKREEKLKRIERIFEEAEREYSLLSKNPLFLIGVILYWAEGSKKSEIFQFSNSDPDAIKAMIKWLTEICKIPKEEIKIRVYIHKVYAHEKCEEFWSQITGIPLSRFYKTIYKPTPHKLKKNPNYKGCVQIRVLKTEFFWKVMGWIEKLKKNTN